MFNWLMLAHFKNIKERNNCYKHLDNVTVQPGVTIYAFLFGPNTNSPIQMRKISSKGQEHYGDFPFIRGSNNKYERYVETLKHLVKSIQSSNVKIHGVDYYGHSSGLELGTYYQNRIFCTTVNFVKHVLKPLRPKVVIFDSCYMGLISALYELSQVSSIQFVMASPSFHPSYSVLETKSFGKIGTGSRALTKSSLSRHLRNVSCEFQQITFPSYRCFLVFDLQKIPAFVDSLKDAILKEQFKFDKNSVVVKEDSMYDLYKACTSPELKKKMNDICKHACGMHKCKYVRGMSIDIDLPELHVPIYKTMAWYGKMKDLLYNKKST